MSISAMKQAVDYLRLARDYGIALGVGNTTIDDAIRDLLAAIAEAEKCEPVAWLNKKIPYMSVLTKPDDGGGWFPVFTHPQPAIPAGYALVPISMVEDTCPCCCQWSEDHSEAMLAAAPKPENSHD